jgi:hypothetical protein
MWIACPFSATFVPEIEPVSRLIVCIRFLPFFIGYAYERRPNPDNLVDKAFEMLAE